ncbi:hypothetical protein CLAFUW4_00022 [Fulvia fulva]|uniref:Uncharacterized protein n=1 Tax=Passalora fulva TaxID=5499 RepID=A0A9Q8P3F6_PASFU|nr:uncharacterized protein CLAFUR5_00021 [Fulvia fulva]KAK4635329.1 hypothetical protein CLAFUR4_00022 [Fulvia fulva]KAK4637922.1 hypothetical protein CLAFUR0_00022 [Fulvia fulva]UJO11701.1 hypothetical protein CLAFUR5_00021 [Fulvia fulva]WPV09971.1 hypothetical protein CLAFUW4_00022 [Fulvia fulva]WPV23505.1 hypothetical protein CLAFUW7_00022 [Fulvia fulva]
MQLLPLLFTTLTTAEYLLQSNFTGPSFLDNFDFYTSWDPTFGYVHYVDRATAEQYGMINVSVAGGPAIFGAEHTQVLDP